MYNYIHTCVGIYVYAHKSIDIEFYVYNILSWLMLFCIQQCDFLTFIWCPAECFYRKTNEI